MEKTDNEIIAEFMGWKIEGEPEFKAPYEIWVSETGARMYPRIDPEGNRYPEKFQFNNSWDWLMPVVEKIKSIKYRVEIHLHYIQSRCEIYGVDFDTKAVGGFQVEKDALLIEHVYKAVIEFIKWYNSQK